MQERVDQSYKNQQLVKRKFHIIVITIWTANHYFEVEYLCNCLGFWKVWIVSYSWSFQSALLCLMELHTSQPFEKNTALIKVDLAMHTEWRLCNLQYFDGSVLQLVRWIRLKELLLTLYFFDSPVTVLDTKKLNLNQTSLAKLTKTKRVEIKNLFVRSWQTHSRWLIKKAKLWKKVNWKNGSGQLLDLLLSLLSVSIGEWGRMTIVLTVEKQWWWKIDAMDI